MKKVILVLICILAIISCSKNNEVAAPYISVTESVFEVSAYGEKVSVSVMSNVAWTVFADSWMELKCQKKGDETTVTVTVQENESDKERLGFLSFEASGITEKVQIRQGVKEVVYTPYSEYYAQWDAVELIVPVKIIGGGSCTVQVPESASGWISIVSGENTNGKELLFKLEPNNSEEARSVEVKLVGNNGMSESFVKIIQGASKYVLTYTTTDGEEFLMELEHPELKNSFMRDNQKIKSVKIPYGVVSIGRRAFEGCEALEEIFIPCSVEKIGADAFYKDKSLKVVVLPDNITEMEEGVFALCENLESVRMPKGLVKVPKDFCNQCSMLKNVEMHPDVMEIGERAFYRCTSLKSIDLPYGMEKIGEKAFQGCALLIGVEFPSTLKSLGYSAFAECSSIKEVSVPSGIAYFGHLVFGRCVSLEKAALQNGIKKVPDAMFSACESLKELYLPESIEAYGASAFEVTAFEEFTVSEGVKIINDYVFNSCKKLERIYMPNTVQKIYSGAFQGCDGLVKVEVPESVTFLGDYVFNGCDKLEEVIIRAPLTHIWEGAFNGCGALKVIELYADVPPELANGAFEKQGDKILKVPGKSVDAYKRSKFADYFSTIESL